MNAEHGDALLLHCGTTAKPRHILFDGGPAGVYQKVVRPRLQAIAAARGVAPLPLDHAFVTHIDDDHIRGILDFLADMERDAAPAQCDSFWFNAFNSIKQEIPPELADVASIARLPGDRQSSRAVLASVAQGEDLRDMAKRRAAGERRVVEA
jgi:glyoxylase-like metal-dependent hydrolase (beta-lactamase superfamily II)